MNKAAFIHRIFIQFATFGLALGLSACSSLLPHSTQKVQAPWADYAGAEEIFNKITPEKTKLADLNALGIDPAKTSNIAILNRADLLRRLMGTGSFDIALLDTALRSCLSSQATCFAYEMEQVFTEKKRVGNFWLDFLNFRKQIDIAGWQFNAIVVINNETVIYKQWSGKPSIRQTEEERSPLGPLQGFGPSLLLKKY